MKRAGIYFFYDKDGIVDRYVPYFISKLHQVVDYIVVVVNGKLTAEGRKVLAETADDLFVRENKGFDAWAYKEAIEYIGWKELLEYDELVLVNYTVFGPVFPFQQIFEKMEEDECDFWGMFTSYERPAKSWFGIPLKWGYIPESIISNFRVYKHSVLSSYEFRAHWDRLPEIQSYFESCVYHEMEISKTLCDAGFVMAAADQGEFKNKCPSPTVYGAYEALAQYKIPIIRRKAFFDPNGDIGLCTEVPRKIIRYLQENTTYGVSLIWENLLRTTNQYDLRNWFNWNKVIPADYSLLSGGTSAKIAVIFHSCSINSVEKHLHNIESFPKETDFYFITDTQENQTKLQNFLAPYDAGYHIEYRITEGYRQAISSLLIICRDVVTNRKYDLICFIGEKEVDKNSSQYSFLEEVSSDDGFENIASTKEYVENVIRLFQIEPHLGIAVPPPPENGDCYKMIGGYWGKNYKNVEALLSELNLHVPLDPQKPPVTPYGTVFWFRPDALLPLFKKEWKYEDFEVGPEESDGTILNAVERVYSLVAQARGYYPFIIMNVSYAEREITRITEIAHTYIDLTLQYVGQKPGLKAATMQFVQMLQMKKGGIVPVKTRQGADPALGGRKIRGRIRGFARAVCPIGLWNVFRRLKCAMSGGVYVETRVYRTPLKSVVRSCMPRFLWDQLRKAKCRENGWVFIPED